MTEQLNSEKDKIEHDFTMKVINLELKKHMELAEAIHKSKGIQWPAFFLSLLFVIYIWAILNLGRVMGDNFFIKEIVVSLGFNIVFTFGFSYALINLLNYKFYLNLNLGTLADKDVGKNKNERMFYWSLIITFVLSMLFSMSLYQLWIKGEFVSSIIDFAILGVIFIHMLLGLNYWYTVRHVSKISRTYNKEIIQVIDEYEQFINK